MAHWLLKSEPFKYSWDKMVADGRTHWDGVRNHQAAINLKAMAVGDTAFFYHSNEGKEIVGIVKIVRTAYLDPSDEAGRFVMVDVAPVGPVKRAVTLAAMKADVALAELALIRQSRLSVVPVSTVHWAHIMTMAGMPIER
jgi:predicted RNA-binding protein with PUA-like domain